MFRIIDEIQKSTNKLAQLAIELKNEQNKLDHLKKLSVLNERVGECDFCKKLFGELDLRAICKNVDCGASQTACFICFPIVSMDFECQNCSLPLCDCCYSLFPTGFCDQKCMKESGIKNLMSHTTFT